MAGRYGRTGNISPSTFAACQPVPSTPPARRNLSAKPALAVPAAEGGCRVCSLDDDHPSMLICDSCDGEYHIYCLDPPLASVPEGDWSCADCCGGRGSSSAPPARAATRAAAVAAASAREKARAEARSRLPPSPPPLPDDGLPALISGLPSSHTCRFGEIVWAQGGAGFGWWPACVYDPLLAAGSARSLALRSLGRRPFQHLTYFFECSAAPFAALADSKLLPWEEGLAPGTEHYLGRTARAAGKARGAAFDRALQAALLEVSKPHGMRMSWDRDGGQGSVPDPILSPPGGNALISLGTPRPAKRSRWAAAGAAGTLTTPAREGGGQRRRGGSGLGREQDAIEEEREVVEATPPVDPQSLAYDMHSERTLQRATRQRPSSPLVDDRLYCKILVVRTPGTGPPTNIGFVALPSRSSATFVNVRAKVETELSSDLGGPGAGIGGLPLEGSWRFYAPRLGPISSVQEDTLGPILGFLTGSTSDPRVGEGTKLNPLKVLVVVGGFSHRNSDGGNGPNP